MSDDARIEEARAEAQRRGVGGYARHVFLCVGPDCCTEQEGLAAWKRLKSEVGRLNKDGTRAPIYRTKVGCLRICTQGPTAVIYPEGTWYAGLDPRALQRVIDEDLAAGSPVTEHTIGQNPLPLPNGKESPGS